MQEEQVEERIMIKAGTRRRVEGKDGGEGCNSLLSPSPAPSPNLPRTINQIRRQTLIEDYHATGSSTHTHTERERELACNRIYSHTYLYADYTEKVFSSYCICSLCTDFYQLGCTVYQSHRGSVGSQQEVRAQEIEKAQSEQNSGEKVQWGEGERRKRQENNGQQQEERQTKRAQCKEKSEDSNSNEQEDKVMLSEKR